MTTIFQLTGRVTTPPSPFGGATSRTHGLTVYGLGRASSAESGRLHSTVMSHCDWPSQEADRCLWGGIWAHWTSD